MPDSKMDNSSNKYDEFEREFVHEFYSKKSGVFSDSRVKPWPFIIEFFRKYYSVGDFILDAGCGNGRQFEVNEYIKSSHVSLSIVGLDYSFELLKESLRKSSPSRSISLVRGTVHRLPFRSDSFDIVLSIAVIHHLSTHSRRVEAMIEMKRVMRVGGIGLIYAWHKCASIKKKFKSLERQEINSLISEHAGKRVEWNPQMVEISPDMDSPRVEVKDEVPNGGDYLVSWKGEDDLLRYYYLFDEDGLRSLCEEAGFAVECVSREEQSVYAIIRRNE